MGAITFTGILFGDFAFNIGIMFAFVCPLGMLLVVSGWKLLIDGQPIKGSSLVSWRVLLLAGVLLLVAMILLAVMPLFIDTNFNRGGKTGIGALAAIAIGYITSALELRRKDKGSWIE